MINVAEGWVGSGRFANIEGKDLRPIPDPLLPDSVLVSTRGQAEAYYLKGWDGQSWILKKFLPGKRPDEQYIRAIGGLVPRRPGLESGYERTILTSASLSAAGYYTPEFAAWIENSILMPVVGGIGWADLADSIRDGTQTLTVEQRLSLCRNLSETVRRLESKGLSHRDLSSTNILLDLTGPQVNLIDWDSLYHKTLSMPSNTTWGTPGYIAPFVKTNGVEDPQVSWAPHSDRFSLGVLNAEFLGLDSGSSITGDGGAFEQSELYDRGGPKLDRLLEQVEIICPRARVLFERCLNASSFDRCPAPAQWIAAARGEADGSPFRIGAGQQFAFVKLDRSLFVALDKSAFIDLNSDAFSKRPIG
jgi:serine/threonine protein kinase